MELVAVLEFPESAASRLAAMQSCSMGEDLSSMPVWGCSGRGAAKLVPTARSLTSGCLRPAHLIVVSEPRPPCEITSSARLAAGFLGAKYRR